MSSLTGATKARPFGFGYLLICSVQCAEHLITDTRRGDEQVLADPSTVKIFVQKKFAAVHFVNFTAGGLNDHACGRQALKRFIGDDGRVGPALSHIADMGGGAPHVSDFTGEGGAVLLVETGVR